MEATLVKINLIDNFRIVTVIMLSLVHKFLVLTITATYQNGSLRILEDANSWNMRGLVCGG